MFLSGFVFLFKQKTAYELRISDWSSDVCSSDLHVRRSFSVGERDVWVCCLEAADVESPLERKVAVRWLKVRGVRIFNVSVGLNTGLVRFGHPGHQLLVEELGCYYLEAGRQALKPFVGSGKDSRSEERRVGEGGGG